MTENQKTLVINLARCNFKPGVFDKWFARKMNEIVTRTPEKKLTPNQHKYLCEAVMRYRRQLPNYVVEIAASELKNEKT